MDSREAHVAAWQRALRAQEDVDLTHTKYDDAWTALVIVFWVFWSLILVWTVRIGRRERTRTRGSTNSNINDRASQPGRYLRTFVLVLNVLICVLRIVFFVDPRGWEDVYGSLARELLLRVPICVMLAQWLLVVLRWHDLKMFTRSKGMKLMVRWTPARWKKIVAATVGTLSSLIVLFTFLSEAGVESDRLETLVNWLFGLYSGVFCVVACYVGHSAATALFSFTVGDNVMQGKGSDQHMPRYKSNGTEGGEEALKGAGSFKAGSFKAGSFKQRSKKHVRARQILFSLLLAAPSTLLVIAASIWRGAKDLTPGEFLAYLLMRHVTEVVMCATVLFAVKDDPELILVWSAPAAIRAAMGVPAKLLSRVSVRLSGGGWKRRSDDKNEGERRELANPRLEGLREGEGEGEAPREAPVVVQAVVQGEGEGEGKGEGEGEGEGVGEGEGEGSGAV